MSKKDSCKTQEVTKNRYPNIIAKCAYDNQNTIDTWNRFKTSLGKENYCRNHFDFSDDGRDFFGDLFDIYLLMLLKII